MAQRQSVLLTFKLTRFFGRIVTVGHVNAVSAPRQASDLIFIPPAQSLDRPVSSRPLLCPNQHREVWKAGLRPP